MLHDEFDFGKQRCRRFWDRYTSKTACLMGDLVSWDDYTQMIRDELDLKIDIRLNN